jgi:predicted CopG family antitoxin
MSLLRRAAAAQAEKYRGRASVSAVIERLVERHRAELETEIRDSGN